ncbi:MerR family transcriptional regulator, heat shock protein HspR [Malonomonas rubra DSM 5091]|uniref:MerR family transcriptional regulator, heat shock protein HspR n=1 Tax=Malonomonas rubra DSM 5091 TaxID=1122189 RepID=A0A1M6MG54_MALRU|nr:chaperone modulator CbpM [Malonomonas rubra]SHJ82469.1 MerR family transcriptional regulator, heat shock protein HspR [Malonomonas rubra DSM 5091]
MKKYPISVDSDNQKVHFEYRLVARMARVSEEFIHRCEHEDLVTAHTMLHGAKGLTSEDISKIKLIRHLHQDMGLNLEAIDFVLRYRERIQQLESQLNELRQQLRQEKLEHEADVLTLCRRLAKLNDNE